MHAIPRSCLWATLAITLAVTPAACGDDSVNTTSSAGSSSSTVADTSSSSGIPTTGTPTTSGDSESASSGSGSATEGSSGAIEPGTTTGTTGPDLGTSSSSTGDDTTTTSSSSTGDDTTTTSSSSTGDDTTTTSSSSTGDESSSSTGDDFACDAPPFPDLSAAPVLAGGCPQTAESHWCLALTPASVTAIGLDTQTTCQAAALQTNDIEVFAVGSFGVVGSELFTCTSEFDGLVTRVDLLTGAVELSTVPCTAVTTWRGHLLVQDNIGGDTLDLYQDWDALKLAQVAWSFNPNGMFSETLTTEGDTLFAAWHSDNHVDRFDLPCGEPLGPVNLDNFDDWMQGIAVTDDNRLLTFGFSYPGLRSFDADLGTDLGALPNVPLNAVGLGCFAKQ